MERQPVLQDALVEAIARNEVKAVEKLLHCGASISVFEIDAERGTDKSEVVEIMRRASQHLQHQGHYSKRAFSKSFSMAGAEAKRNEFEQRTHRASWERLFSFSISSGSQPAYVKMLSNEVKESLSQRGSSTLSRALGVCSGLWRSSPSRRLGGPKTGESDSSGEPLEALEMQGLYRLLSLQTLFLKQHIEAQSRTDTSTHAPSAPSHKSHLPSVYKDLKVDCR